MGPYEDIRHRELSNEVQSDLYVAGLPCEPFPNAGLKRGSAFKIMKNISGGIEFHKQVHPEDFPFWKC